MLSPLNICLYKIIMLRNILQYIINYTFYSIINQLYLEKCNIYTIVEVYTSLFRHDNVYSYTKFNTIIESNLRENETFLKAFNRLYVY